MIGSTVTRAEQGPASRRGRGIDRQGNASAVPQTAVSSRAFVRNKPSCPCGGGCPKCTAEATVQAKLKLGAPDDEYEKEADRVADAIVRMPGPEALRQPARQEDAETMQAQPIENAAPPLIRRQADPEKDEEYEYSTPILESVPTGDAGALADEGTAPRLDYDADEEEISTEAEPVPPAPILESIPTSDAGALDEGQEEELVQPKRDANAAPSIVAVP